MRLAGIFTAVAILALVVVTTGYEDRSYYDGNYDYDFPYPHFNYQPYDYATSPYENSSYAYYLNQKLYHAFANNFPPAVYPFLQCVEKLDASTYEPYDEDETNNGYANNGNYYKPKFIWRAHFGYYSAYYKPYQVCNKCSKGFSFDGKRLHRYSGPTEFVSGYSTHFPNSAYHVDFDDGKNAYGSWQIKHLTAIATRKSQRCPIYRYSRLVYNEKSPYVDVAYLKFAYSLSGPWVDTFNTSWYGPGASTTRDAGYTYFGQFVDHDITKDPIPGSELDPMYNSDKNTYIREPDWYAWPPYKIKNGRTPLLDLDSVYGRYGRDLQYRDANDTDKLKEGEGDDVPRDANGTALIPEDRNDENLIICQFHYMFIEFHNHVVDWIRERDYEEGCEQSVAVFERAKKIVLWHYQYLVLNVYLPKVVHPDILKFIHRYGRQHYIGLKAQKMWIPVEFAVAGYRYHSIVRNSYMLNSEIGFKTVFNATDMSGNTDMRGGKYLQKNGLEADWRLFFDFEDEDVRSLSGRLFDENVVPSLLNLPNPPAYAPIVDSVPLSLPVRTIIRGSVYGVPSGEALAKAFHVQPLNPYDVNWYVKGYYRSDGNYNSPGNYDGYDEDYSTCYDNYEGTPLWYYLCRESMKHSNGEQLGYVGSIIVAETLIGLLQSDPDSYLNAAPGFRPFLYEQNSENGYKCSQGHSCVYRFQDLLDFIDLRKPESSSSNS